MLKVIRHCEYCSTEMETVRSTKRFCSEACRKRAERGGIEQQAEGRRIVNCLQRLGLIDRLWPVYDWDQSPPVFALMTTSQAAVDELNLNLSGDRLTVGELERALRDCGIETTSASERQKAEIKAFYDARKDRRIGKGYTPSDSCNSAP
jgi:hypothetical protein